LGGATAPVALSRALPAFTLAAAGAGAVGTDCGCAATAGARSRKATAAGRARGNGTECAAAGDRATADAGAKGGIGDIDGRAGRDDSEGIGTIDGIGAMGRDLGGPISDSPNSGTELS
jgi:hypothetical protein